MDIQILGTGCHDCLKLELLVGQVLAELGAKGTVRQVEDPRQIDRYVLARPPGQVIDGDLVAEGRLPSPEEIRHWIVDALSWERQVWAF